ncbi:restriction endonuclease subunit S [Methyloversatilis sp.]|uniref:restriction endonuclease subunit S n=1 Tax=Methyloversatilis sp. TaxID=2569862 RepID=UPI0027BB0398|nr:restriction endonuclease subunit S [Methyloversatilis sp.]
MSDGTPLPAGWTWASLGELLIGIEAGKSFKCQERPPHAYEVGVVKVSAVTWGEYQELESKTCTDTEMVNPALFIQAGDLLFSRANTIELVGACVIARYVTLPLMLSDKILRLKLARDSMKRWVLYLLRSDQGRRQIEALSSGNQESMRNIGQERIAQIRVPLPPFAEQTRIVEKLEELLSDLDAGVAELKAAQKKLALYRQSLLKAAVEGALSADWRARRAARGESLETGADLLARILTERRARWEARQLEKFKEQGKTPPKGWQAKYPEPVRHDTEKLPMLPEGWAWASVAQLGDVTTGSTPSTTDAENFGDAIPFFRPGDLDAGYYVEQSRERLSEAGAAMGRVLPEKSVLVTCIGATIGKTGFARVSCATNQQINALSVSDDGVIPEFVYWLMVSGAGQRQIIENASATTLPILNKSKFEKLVLPIAPLPEQTEIVSVLETESERISIQETAIKHALRQAIAQRKNLLKAAFSGQLVPQDPNDEPASALLARIRAEREGRASSDPARRKRRSAHA